jgi:hypothetical protein
LHGQSDAPWDAATLEALLYENLPAQLLQIVLRTMVLELNVARMQGELKGDLRAGGTLHVRRADIRVPDKMPASVAVGPRPLRTAIGCSVTPRRFSHTRWP